jgi:hypothetical protein
MSTMYKRAVPFSILLCGVLVAGIGCNKTNTVDDATLTTRVKAALAADTAIAQQPVQYAVQSGVVTLSGNVSNDTVSAVAAQDVSKVDGVKEVVNDLSVAGIAVAPTVVAPGSTQARPTTPVERQAIAQHQPLPPPAQAQPVANPPELQYRDVQVQAGTVIPIRITQTLDSETAQPGQPFDGVVLHEVVANGLVVIPAGSAVSGRVVDAKDATHFKGSSMLSIQLNSVRVRGHLLHVESEPYTVEGKGRGRNSAEKIGGGAAIGAVLGGIFGGGKGAAIGAAAGGGGGAVLQGATRGQQVVISSESVIRFRTDSSFSVRTAELPYERDQPQP